MNYATPGQVLHAAKMMVDTKVLENSARFLEESGFLTDLFKANLTKGGQVRIARSTFQRFLGMEPDGDAILTLAHPEITSELLKNVRRDDLLNDENFPYRRRDTVIAEIVSFPWSVSLRQAIEFATLWGLTPLEYEDAFVWAYALLPPIGKREQIVFAHAPVLVNGEPRIVILDSGLWTVEEDFYKKIDRSWKFMFAQKRIPPIE